jgi:hypothetical protein
MKKPVKGDFGVKVNEADVEVTFKPTKSQYTFARQADRHSLSQLHSVRHAKMGDIGDYVESEVRAMARLALQQLDDEQSYVVP